MRSFPHACVETRGKVKERKAGGWNHRKGQSEVKEWRKSTRDREADRLKCQQKKKEREIDKKDTGYMPFIWELECIPCCFFSLLCSAYFPNEFKRLSVVNRCDFSFVSRNISFGVEYSNTVVKLPENRDGNFPAFNAYNIVINLNL